MGVRKFRDVSEMPGPAPRPPLDPENLRLACELADLTRRLSNSRRRAGVRKYRSFDDLRRHRDTDPGPEEGRR